MSIMQYPAKDVFFPPHLETPHLAEVLDEIIGEVTEVIAPVWPLQDYVAVNPYAGISHRSFLDARAFLKVFSDCETLMPLRHYTSEMQRGHFTVADIHAALTELGQMGISQGKSASEIAESLSESLLEFAPNAKTPDQQQTEINHQRRIGTFAEFATRVLDIDWTEAIVDEISKHCSAHYDTGQAIWSSPFKHLSLYQAWRSAAEHDCNIEILGLSGFRKFVARMPLTPEAAIVHSLQRLEVPVTLWSTFLLCQAFSIPGWSAWAKYQTSWKKAEGVLRNDLTELLAIRLAYDAALAKSESLSMNWSSILENESVSFMSMRNNPGDDTMMRYVLLRASEIGYRNCLLSKLSLAKNQQSEIPSERKLAQL